MIETAGGLCFVEKHLAGQHIRASAVVHIECADFDGHVPIKPLIVGAIDNTHPALADLLDDAVVSEGLTDKVCHRLWFLVAW